MDTYTKLFTSILNSTIWQEPMPTRIVWITMLAMSDKNGEVESSIPGLASRAKVSVEECKEALLKFLSPDEYSRTKDNEGRRIEEIVGGWRLLNHAAYRAKMGKDDRREYQRIKQAAYRAKKANSDMERSPEYLARKAAALEESRIANQKAFVSNNKVTEIEHEH